MKQTFKQFLYENNQYNNWSFPNQQTIEADFSEYKKKEEKKWKGRAKQMGMRFPIFETKNDFKQSLKQAKVIDITNDAARKINHLTQTKSIEHLEDLVSGYIRPRDVQRIKNGIENNEPIPYPIILQGNNGMFIMAGNTRINVARILGNIPKALLVDVKEKT